MLRALVPIGLLLWVGLTLLLHELRWFSRPSLTARLSPYVPGGMGSTRRVGLLSTESFREAVGPLARTVGERPWRGSSGSPRTSSGAWHASTRRWT